MSRRGRGGTSSSYYAVAAGRKPGIYCTWNQCENQIKGFSGSKHKKFKTKNEAEKFIQSHVGFVTKIWKPTTTSPSPLITKNINTKIALSSRKFTKIIEKEKGKEKKEKEEGICGGDGGRIQVYTDGACSGNGTKYAIAGVGVWFGDGDNRNISEKLEGKVQTNQRAELTAVIRSIETVKKEEKISSKTTTSSLPMSIKTDSLYVMNGITKWIKNWKKNGWKK